MDDFTSDILKVLNKPSTSLSEMNSNMELLNNFSESNHPICSQGYGFLDYFSNNNFSSNDSSTAYPSYLNDIEFTFDQTNGHVPQSVVSIGGNLGIENDEKNSMPMSEFMEMGSSSGFRMDHTTMTNGRKRKRKNEERLEKPREVIHVRAKRGQATDSHSLAERVRREKINDKLRVLQDLVPGCYKTMGMAVMLDVIINYVRSLQNQIEFLSMKLSAASLYYDFNSPEAEALESLHRMTTNPCDNYHGTNKAVRSEEYQVHSPAWPF